MWQYNISVRMYVWFSTGLFRLLYFYSEVIIIEMIDIIITITSVGVQSLDAFISTLGYGGT